MKTATSGKFKKYQSEMAEDYGVENVAEHFTATPSIAQTLISIIQLSSDFLGRINLMPVDEVKGQKVGVGVSGSIVSRTDTSGAGSRSGEDVSATNDKGYECFQQDSDVLIPYSLMDSWAKFKDFAEKLNTAIMKRRALDLIMVGWNGTSVAATTNRGANPLGQDVNKGWLQLIRDEAPAQIIQTALVVNPDGSADYKNFDECVSDIYSSIGEPYKSEGGHIVIVGKDILAAQQAKFYADNAGTPSEKMGIKKALETYGGLEAYEVPYFPADAVLVTKFENLSIYTQDSSVRRATKDTPEKNGVQDFNSSNVAYVVEEYENVSAIDSGQLTFA